MQLHFEIYGQGEPLIILHGLFGSLDNWRTISQRLSAGFRVIGIDQRNHGRSPHSFGMDYNLMAEDVSELIAGMGLADAFVLGHSMGGKTAMQLALLYPHLVRKLVVADIAPREYGPRHEKAIRGMLALDLNRFQSRQEMDAALALAVPDVVTRQFLLKNVARTESQGFVWRIGLKEISKNYDRLREAVTGHTPFEKPTLFIRGEHSDFLLEDDWEAIRRLFPQARLQTLEGAGHLLHVSKPDAFITALYKFLGTGSGLRPSQPNEESN